MRIMRKVRKVYPKLVKDNIIPRSKTVVFMNPKEFPFEAGLTDRFKGIISVYDACKRKGLPFKIYYTTPNLNDFLLPNLYDWHIDKEDICFDLRYTSTCYLVTYHHDDNYWQLFTQRCALNFFLKNRRKKQIHVFSNTTTSDARYGELYNELFKPTPLLKKQIDYHLEQLGGVNLFLCRFE